MSQGYVIGLMGWLVFSMLSPVVYAQEGSDKPYLPLGIGNEWTYYTLYDHPDGIDTTIFNPRRITESFDIEGKTYYRYPQPIFFGLETLRTDDEGRVFAWHNNEDMLLFDFTLPDSATYVYEGSRDPEYPYIVTVRRGVTVDVLGGRFLDCITFTFDIPEFIDDAQSYTFYPGVGLVRHIGGMGEHTWLFEARIDGEIVTATEEVTVPDEISSAAAFPNPFRETTTLRFNLDQPGHATLKIYDVLGREVATLMDGFVEAVPQQVVWEGQAHPAGVYIARLQIGGMVRSMMLVRTR